MTGEGRGGLWVCTGWGICKGWGVLLLRVGKPGRWGFLPGSGKKGRVAASWCELGRLSGAAIYSPREAVGAGEGMGDGVGRLCQGGGEVVGREGLGGAGGSGGGREGRTGRCGALMAQGEVAATPSLEQSGRWRRPCLGRGGGRGALKARARWRRRAVAAQYGAAAKAGGDGRGRDRDRVGEGGEGWRRGREGKAGREREKAG